MDSHKQSRRRGLPPHHGTGDTHNIDIERFSRDELIHPERYVSHEANDARYTLQKRTVLALLALCALALIVMFTIASTVEHKLSLQDFYEGGNSGENEGGNDNKERVYSFKDWMDIEDTNPAIVKERETSNRHAFRIHFEDPSTGEILNDISSLPNYRNATELLEELQAQVETAEMVVDADMKMFERLQSVSSAPEDAHNKKAYGTGYTNFANVVPFELKYDKNREVAAKGHVFGLASSDVDWAYQNALEVPLLKRPIMSPDKADVYNKVMCPSPRVKIDYNDPTQKPPFVENEVLWSKRIELVKYLISAKELLENPRYIPDSAGIVYTAGNSDTWERAAASIAILREHGCQLGIEIFHMMSEVPPPNIATKLKKLKGVSLRTILLTSSDPRHWKNFHVKAEALMRSSFQYLLYLDSDNIAIRDPTYLFESKEFQTTGLLLWPDFFKSWHSNPMWQLVGLPCRDEYEAESGQILVDKARNMDVLITAQHMAMEREFYFGLTGGDKDTFRFSAYALGKKFSGPGRILGSLGIRDKTRKDDQEVKFMGLCMVQYDTVGKPLFLHSNLIKHVSPGFEIENPYEVFKTTLDGFMMGGYGSLRSPGLGDDDHVLVYEDRGLYVDMEPYKPRFDNGGSSFINGFPHEGFMPGSKDFLEIYKRIAQEYNIIPSWSN